MDSSRPVNTFTGIQETAQFGPLTVHFDHRLPQPREWTTHQGMWAAELARDLPDGPLLELCCGTGQIGLLAVALSDRGGVLVDVDPVACTYAEFNAITNGLSSRVSVRPVSFTVAMSAGERFPLITIDAPCLPTAEVEGVDAPTFAVDGGHDGLDVAKEALWVASEHLTDSGQILLAVSSPAQVSRLDSWLGEQVSPDLRLAEVRPHGDDGLVLRFVASSADAA